MRTLHIGLRVADLDRSLAFYRAVGYEVVGAVPDTPIGHLVMLKLPGDEFVSVELVHDGGPVIPGTGLSHIVVHVESMFLALDRLRRNGILPTGEGTDGEAGFSTRFIIDPDGRRIELVQWPAGHAAGLGAVDWSG
ncbi:lactoylglutathione lyase [Lentzea fradiae]|uniref:Lactoylglutathione lyase n=1 Tax=Lentzea fradiae TaxID=200378 RepID=A0A1G7SSF1_9PSEU|nr:VOC family protein [Lentzea fradiae]SDG26017.1 lactoylglutathione lyase [Lentzea fradiae]